MNNMISVASGFQYAVNIGYDLNQNDKLKIFIPTKSALQLLQDILQSTTTSSTERARVLVGAYGKGKSHIVLTILAILMQKSPTLFTHLWPKIAENNELQQLVHNYYDSPKNKLLPVIISGANTSLPQAFLLALQRTLQENDLDLMPETNYGAAIQTINKWKEHYPAVYANFIQQISVPIDVFLSELAKFNVVRYEEFERIYPELTAGSVFNPFIGFDVVDLYESVAKSLKAKGYLGLYVVYDEFSKFLEANITEASVSDTKMLQDFAEKCNRSGDNQMHLLLISHKEISNYIDQLPKQKVDGWRGVAERFKHIHLNNNFAQTYEIISTVIIKQAELWQQFIQQAHNKEKFTKLISLYQQHPIFGDTDDKEFTTAIYGCYPLHPVSTFLLPRISEQVAQNERTLFTFLSVDGASTLLAFLKQQTTNDFQVITPDIIFDYFEQVFQKEPIAGEIHKNYILTMAILEQIRSLPLESKIVKTLSLIYTLGQFEKLKPTKDEIVRIFEMEYSIEEINTAIEHLINEEYVIYLKRSNDFLKLKRTSGVDIEQKIKDAIASSVVHFSLKLALNTANVDSYLYPARYNDAYEMVRYFKVEFIEEHELQDVDWQQKTANIYADGVIFAIVVEDADNLTTIKQQLLLSSKGCERCIFILPKNVVKIRSVLQRFAAIQELKNATKEDSVLFDEYEVIYEDLRDVIHAFVRTYTHPEEYKAYYIYDGAVQHIPRKAALTELASVICDEVFYDTPVINNEAINRDELTGTTLTSRNKVIAGLLRKELEPNLGFVATSQEASIMRSTLKRMGVLCSGEENLINSAEDKVQINLQPSNNAKITKVLQTIVSFIMEAKKQGMVCFATLYQQLTAPQYHIGLRKGVIPLYLAAVFHEYSAEIIIRNDAGQLPLAVDTLQLIEANPSAYHLSCINWDGEKQHYVDSLATLFQDYVIASECKLNSYDFVAKAMQRWYLALPKYAKETKNADYRYQKILRNLKGAGDSTELLFTTLPQVFASAQLDTKLISKINEMKQYFDTAVTKLTQQLVSTTIRIFASQQLAEQSLTAVLQAWYAKLQLHIEEQLFANGTEKFLALCKDVGKDETTFISKVAKLATGLSLVDWNDDIEPRFAKTLTTYKTTAENFQDISNPTISQTQVSEDSNNTEANTYEIKFCNPDGSVNTKRFMQVTTSKKGKLMYNSI